MSGGFALPGGGGGHAPALGTRSPSICSVSMALPTSQVELSVRCEKLVDKDVLSKSDPVCVMFMKPKGAGNKQSPWVEIGRTEMIKDTLDPEFQKKFVVDYSFEERQLVKFELYDWDAESPRLSSHDFLGRCETTLGSIVSSQGSCFASVLQDLPNRGAASKIFITAEELEVNKELVTLQLSAEKLDKKDFFGKSDPFFVISKGSRAGGKFVVVKKSETIMKTLNPTWAQFNISVRDLCNNNYDRPLKIEVYDWNSSGNHDIIGSFMTSLADLVEAGETKKDFPVILDKKKGKKNYKNSGVIKVRNIEVTKQASFLDYIKGGTSMNFSVAIDFTASNGNPVDPRSLHYSAPGQDNQYVTAIRSVGSIVEDYDTDKMFPALGFGARVPPTQQVSHEFFLNLSPNSPYCKGVDGLLQAYFTSLHNVTLYGPTNFSPVIKHVSKFAQAYQDGRQYFVLLIITDGIITDLDQTIYSIIDASRLPMSIIIVGVGNEDFSAMEALDSDDSLLQLNAVRAVRDIVQFVELRKFVGPGGTFDKELLAKEVLAEIPTQVTDWMKMKGVRPGNPSPPT